MSKKSATGMSLGGASILVIFIILCLTTFSTLSMVSANADLKLTEKAADATAEYYTADATAEEILAVIDGIIKDAAMASSADAYEKFIRDKLSALVPDITVESGGGVMTATYTVPVNERQVLAVRLRLLPYQSTQADRIERTGWTVQSDEDWEPEQEGLNLWQGGELAGIPIE